MTERLSIVVLTGGGPLCLPVLARLQKDPAVQIRGIVFDTEADLPRRGAVETLMRLVKYQGLLGALRYGASRMLKTRREQKSPCPDDSMVGRLQAFARAKGIRLEIVNNLNSEPARTLVRDIGAPLGVVIGTRILTPELFTIPSQGMINIHQGRVPFYRGGACTFWSVFNDEKELGVTVHGVVADVDAGPIVLQETMPLAYDFRRYGTDVERFMGDMQEPLNQLSVDLMARAVHLLATGAARWVPVDPNVGRRYRKPTYRQKQALKRLLTERYAHGGRDAS